MMKSADKGMNDAIGELLIGVHRILGWYDQFGAKDKVQRRMVKAIREAIGEPGESRIQRAHYCLLHFDRYSKIGKTKEKDAKDTLRDGFKFLLAGRKILKASAKVDEEKDRLLALAFDILWKSSVELKRIYRAQEELE